VTAWFYGVVSAEKQADTLADQARWAEETATAHGWTITRTFSDPSSGKHGVRGLLEEMLAALRATPPKERPKRILLTRIDRLGRGLAIEAIGALAEIRKLGVTLHTRESGDVRLERVADAVDPMFRALAGAFENEGKRDRVNAMYAARDRRGEERGNRAPFGLERKDGRFVPGPQAWVVQQADTRYLAGERGRDILDWLASVAPTGWKSHDALLHGLQNDAYVRAGVRTPETAAAIKAQARARDKRVSKMLRRDHEFAAVFVCGRCLALGFAPAEALMGAQLGNDPYTNTMVPYVTCQTVRGPKQRHAKFMVRVARIEGAWGELVAQIGADGWAEDWAAAAPDATPIRRRLERALAKIDQVEAKIAGRRDAALDLYADSGARRQAVEALTTIDADLAALHVQRETIRGDLAALETTRRDPDAMRKILGRYDDVYALATLRQRNHLNRLVCAAVGSHPVLDRDADHKWGTVIVRWPEVRPEPVLVPYRASSRSTSMSARRCTSV
jgi:DNA invertase Pin-like site-specific DNA recombinase